MDDAVGGIVTPVLDRIDGVLGQAYSALIYGSAARGEFRDGVSDVNLLLVCQELGPATLRRLSAALAGLRGKRQSPPLLIERGEWASASDVFPIEVTDMQLAHQLVRGEDPLAGRVVDPADLRRALEAELRAKLLRLRQAYALAAGDAASLGAVASGTVASVAALFRVSLVLFGRDVPAGTPAALAAAGQAMAVAMEPVAALWTRRVLQGPPCAPELFEGYLAAVAAAVRVIDTFSRGGK
jgi:predicted nucleotidyltransferase